MPLPQIQMSQSAGALSAAPPTSEMDRMRLNFLPEFVSMRRKIAAVAVTYDPKTMGNLLRAAFGGDALTPTQLTEALRRTLQITLTPSELGALVMAFDKDGDGCVSCTEFLAMFFSEGRKQKERDVVDARAEKARRDAKREARTAAKIARMTALTKMRPAKYAAEDRERGLARLAGVAKHWDPQRPNNSLKSFIEGGEMDVTVFAEQMRSNFNLALTPAEATALHAHFDAVLPILVACADNDEESVRCPGTQSTSESSPRNP